MMSWVMKQKGPVVPKYPVVPPVMQLGGYEQEPTVFVPVAVADDVGVLVAVADAVVVLVAVPVPTWLPVPIPTWLYVPASTWLPVPVPTDAPVPPPPPPSGNPPWREPKSGEQDARDAKIMIKEMRDFASVLTETVQKNGQKPPGNSNRLAKD